MGRLSFATAILAATILFSQATLARQDIVPGSRYTSARAAAMGDAYLPVGEDAPTALFYNPAAMGKIRKKQLEPLNLSFYASHGYLSSLGLNSYNLFSLAAYSPTLTSTPGVYHSYGGQLLPSFAIPGFAIGILGNSQIGAVAAAGGSITYRTLYQLIPAVATGFRLADGIFRMGYSFQWVNQVSGRVAGVSGANIAYNNGLAQGSGFSHNAGVAITLPMAFLPSVNFVGRNLFNTTYMSFGILPLASSPSGVPATEPMTFDLSLSVQPKLGKGVLLNIVTEWRDIFGVTGVPLLGVLAGGLELAVQDVFFIRGGWSSGYPHAGIGIKKRLFEFNFTWTSEEVGATYQSQQDMRWMMEFRARAF